MKSLNLTAIATGALTFAAGMFLYEKFVKPNL